MKKLFTLLAFVAALIFSVAPSQALIGMPDDVPGVDPHLPFFLVDKAGYASNTGLDTLIVIQEVGGEGTQFKTSGSIHIVIRDKKSRDIGSTWKPYTPNDVLAFSVRDLIKECVGVSQLSSLDLTLNGKAYYSGYADFFNSRVDENNLVSFMYIVDLANGWAAANTTPVYEDGSDPGYAERQVFENDGAVVERFSPNAYAISAEREKGNCVADGEAGWFRLMPRWFLKDANAETFIPVWSSSNHILPTGTFLQPIGYIFDNDENILNLPIPLPYELNWLDIREMLTTEWQSKTGGWLEIWIPNTAAFSPTATYPYTYDQGWLAYSYQTASSASVGANWSVLTAAHREVGTLIAD